MHTPERFLFFFNDTATTEIYTLSLHDALPIYRGRRGSMSCRSWRGPRQVAPRSAWWVRSPAPVRRSRALDRKSTRLNSSHLGISYAVFCLKKKKMLASPLEDNRSERDQRRSAL